MAFNEASYVVCWLFVALWVLAGDRSEFGFYSMLGVMTVVALLAFTMRLVYDRNAATEFVHGGQTPWELIAEFR